MHHDSLHAVRPLSDDELATAAGGSGSNTVFLQGNGETGILAAPDDAPALEGGMSGGTGIGG